MFPTITCRPDIFYCVIKLLNCNIKPACVHYLSVTRIFRYLRDTISDELHYWRPNINITITKPLCLTILHDNHDVIVLPSSKNRPIGFVNSDWEGETSHRRSISGLYLCFVGAPIVYRARLQPTISQRFTEAEFIAAVEAVKLALYPRSMLDDLGIE